jgi:hypothetical protein
MSSTFGEIIKKLISVFGEKPARGLPKPPPTPPRLETAKFTRGKNAIPGRGRGFGTRVRGGGNNNAKLNNSSREQHFDSRFQTKIAITFLLLFALTKCAYLLLASLASKNHVLYSEGRAYKREPELAASPQSTTLHSTGNTSVKNGVSRTKSATATHMEQ